MRTRFGSRNSSARSTPVLDETASVSSRASTRGRARTLKSPIAIKHTDDDDNMMRTPPDQKGKAREAGDEGDEKSMAGEEPKDDNRSDRTPVAPVVDQDAIVTRVTDAVGANIAGLLKSEFSQFNAKIKNLSRRLDSVEQSRAQSRASKNGKGEADKSPPPAGDTTHRQLGDNGHDENKLAYVDRRLQSPPFDGKNYEEDAGYGRKVSQTPTLPGQPPRSAIATTSHDLVHPSPTRHPRMRPNLDTLHEEDGRQERVKEEGTDHFSHDRHAPRPPYDDISSRHRRHDAYVNYTQYNHPLYGDDLRDLEHPAYQHPPPRITSPNRRRSTSPHEQRQKMQTDMTQELLKQLLTSRDEVKINANDLPKFYGYEDEHGVDTFVRAVDIFLRSHKVKGDKIVAQLGAMLKGSAQKWWRYLTDDELAELGTDWSKWRAKLLKAFKGAKTGAVLQQAMMHRVLTRGEDVRVYFNDKKSLILRCMPNTPEAVIGNMILVGTPGSWRAGIRWKQGENTLEELFEAMELQSHQLSANWWRADVDHRDTEGRPLPSFYESIHNLGESTSSMTPAKITKTANNTASGTTSTDTSQVYYGATSNYGNRNYSTDPSDPKNKAWAERQKAVLGREPFRLYPPSSPCLACDKGLYHWHRDCRVVIERERNRAQGGNTATPASGSNSGANFRKSENNHYPTNNNNSANRS